MGSDPEDQEIIRLLSKMKDAGGEYPEHMLVARRHSYLKRMGEISLGIPPDMGIKDVKPSHVSSATSTFVETALVVAIIAEAGTVAYFYRDRLADFFRRNLMEPRVQEVVTPPVIPTSSEVQKIAPSPALTVTVPSSTIWSPPTPTGIAVTPTSTPIPGVADNNSIQTVNTGEPSLLNSATTGEATLLNATPGPNDSTGNNGNNGNHYGQTPKPERTKENGNNPPPKVNDDKPPKDREDKPPKEDKDKPPKEDKDKPRKNN